MKRESILLLLAILLSISCNDTPAKDNSEDKAVPPPQKTEHSKPPSSVSDTLVIEHKAAVFFFPDSAQLKKIEELTERGMFESMMHEYEFQERNSKIVLAKNWPGVRIIEARNKRYLLFKRSKGGNTCIDLNSRDDSHGLFLFDGIKEPHYADMMNIDTELPRYFSS